MKRLEVLLEQAFDAGYKVHLAVAMDGDRYCGLWKDGESVYTSLKNTHYEALKDCLIKANVYEDGNAAT